MVYAVGQCHLLREIVATLPYVVFPAEVCEIQSEILRHTACKEILIYADSKESLFHSLKNSEYRKQNGTADLNDDILEESIPLDGIVDLRLIFVGQIDGFGVAPALEVEDAVVIPAFQLQRQVSKR